MSELMIKGSKAKEAANKLATVSTVQKNNALLLCAKALVEKSDTIIAANKIDIDNAKAKGITPAMLDRLTLTSERIGQIAEGIRQIVSLNDPIGEIVEQTVRPNGLQIGARRVPIGVIGVIYEARPNVTADVAALTLKTSNAAILRGGSEAINSNKAMVEVINAAYKEAGLPEGTLQLIEDTSRETAVEFMKLNDYLDVLIPRGGAGLIKTVVNNSTVPVIETGVGNCHTYVDDSADINMALDIAVNAKCSRPAVCNAMETLLVSSAVAEKFLPALAEKMSEYNVEIRGCEKVRKYISAVPATDEDYATEFLDYKLAVKVVDGIDEAISHITKYSTGHSEAIITNSYENSQRFLNEINSAAVYVNASTRFTDGFEFGLGAEIGISTQKIHARGPMGLKALTTIKYVIYGNGQIR
ncbi:MAG: glutamate-5-semialdehyde dehydrogenase [Clostridia bacterium]|nr:glutamate-5-semialdehyde dehydrogenase [Clostridia bacterium]